MIRAVLDANVLVSAILTPKGIPAKILTAWRGDGFSLLTSPALLDELGRVLRYPRIKKRHEWSEKEIETFLEDLAYLAIFTPGELSPTVIDDDPTDDRYLECAVERAADYIVSGDTHLLGLGHYREIQILAPREFLSVLSQLSSSR
ncbi:MAG TPA: putative toxin-antitoxin system toxin component, PIN family [Candidatus Binatia bacterium]|jgi:hypothetical protein